MIRYILIFEEDDKYKTHKNVQCVFHIIYGKYTDRHKIEHTIGQVEPYSELFKDVPTYIKWIKNKLKECRKDGQLIGEKIEVNHVWKDCQNARLTLLLMISKTIEYTMNSLYMYDWCNRLEEKDDSDVQEETETS